MDRYLAVAGVELLDCIVTLYVALFTVECDVTCTSVGVRQTAGGAGEVRGGNSELKDGLF